MITDQFASGYCINDGTTDYILFVSAIVLPVNKVPSKGEMLKKCWQYKSDEGKSNSMFIKMAAQNYSEIWERAIRDRLTVPFLSQKTIKESLRKSTVEEFKLIRIGTWGKKLHFMKK